ncbi:MAG TPA: M1 family metallopeptidase [Casimicrobiaceae bacterium]|nr:M1 family metallopeptidase [Casimicrobiaceae bacterium]
MRRPSHVVAVAVLALAASLPALAQPRPDDPQPPALRLPAGVRPTHYALTLTIVPGADKAPGEMAIDVVLDRPQSVLWLNAASLPISHVAVDGDEAHPRIIAADEQFVGLAFAQPLAAGTHTIDLAFEATQSRNSTRGIFTLQEDGAWYTMTQFESTWARRAFPCFDEPGFKAPWQLTLRVPHDLAAIANAPVAEERDIAGSMKEVRFAQTQPLPSYLVAFAVGPFEFVDAGTIGPAKTPVRIVAGRGRRADAAFAAQALPELLAHEERWFGIDYPFAKLDHIAIPLSVRFAMENAGLITYGGPILLAPRAATAPFRHGLANVGAHETAHQWFGDLVTMAWWDDVWLNEAFATWFADKTVDAWQPGYERGAGRVHGRAYAIEADSLPSARRIREPIVTRGDIFNAFDAITYQKGASVIGMFEGWLGEATFRRGVQAYLAQHRFANATAADFLDALSAASAQPVAPAFSTFLDQNGVPQVRVALDCSARPATLALEQHRHVPAGVTPGNQRWEIPVCVRYGNDDATHEACTLLDKPRATLAFEGNVCPDFVVANAGGRGYYVPEYDKASLARLRERPQWLTSPELASLVYDMRPMLRAGAIDGAQALDWIRTAAASRERSVIAAAIELAGFVRDSSVSAASRPDFDRFVARAFGDTTRALGLAAKAGESDDDALLRRALLRFAGPNDPVVGREARRLARAWIRDPKSVDPGIADTALYVAARTGNAALFDAMMKRLHATRETQDRRNLMVALLSFANPSLERRAFGLLLDPAIDVREATTALSLATEIAPASRQPYDFIASHFDALAARVDPEAPGGWPGYAAALCGSGDRAAVEAFWRPRVARYEGAARNLAQALDSIDACARLRQREQAGVDAYFKRFRTD